METCIVVTTTISCITGFILAIFAQVEKQGRFEGGLLKKRKGKRKEKKEERKKRRKGPKEENKKYQGKGN